MNIILKDKNLTKDEKDEIEKLLTMKDKTLETDLDQMWYLMDLVWDNYGCDNKNLNWENIGKFYSHPVWLLNGLFIEIDQESMSNRKSIAGYFKNKENFKILDYGGGFGTLAKEIAKITPSSKVDIYEPYASKYAYENIKDFKNIKIVNNLKENYYDVLVNTDILEHVENPIGDLAIYNKCLKRGGILVSHWNFTPCIKCHLPKHFHLRYTFNRIVPLLGFAKEIKNERHGHYFLKVKNITKEDMNNAYRKEKISKLYYPINKIVEDIKKIIMIILKEIGVYDWVRRAVKS